MYYRKSVKCSTAWFAVLFGILLSMGCKKEKTDSENPVITIHAPSTGSVFNFTEDIFISATVSDNINLESIRIQITNSSNQSFLNQIEYTNAGTEKNIQTHITHNDLYLNSGTYYVKITAKDNDNESILFRQITLVEAPLELRRIYVVRSNGGATMMDTLGNGTVQAFSTLSHSYDFGEISSRYNLLLANYGDRMSVLEANSTNLMHTEFHNTSSVMSTFNDEQGGSFYTGTNDGYIFKTDRYGATSTFLYQPNQRILNMLVTENFVLADIQNMQQTIRTLQMFHKNSGAFVQSVNISFDLKELIYLGNENLILAVGNEAGEGVLKYYNRQTNFFNQVFTFYNDSEVFNAWQSSANRFIVSQADGLITYNYDLEVINSGLVLQPDKVVFEKLAGLLYAVKSEGIYVLNTNATQQLAYYPATNCKDLLLLYNK